MAKNLMTQLLKSYYQKWDSHYVALLNQVCNDLKPHQLVLLEKWFFELGADIYLQLENKDPRAEIAVAKMRARVDGIQSVIDINNTLGSISAPDGVPDQT
jgi:hypothetical protein